MAISTASLRRNASASLNSPLSSPLKTSGRLPRRWQTLEPREQTLILAATGVVVAALLWWLAIAPALSVLKTDDAQRAALDAQLQSMQALQAQAKAVQGQPKMTAPEASRALTASVKQRLGAAAQVSLAGSQATVTLKGVPPAALADWLSQARLAARAVPIQANLRRSNGEPATWDGTLVLSLPAQ